MFGLDAVLLRREDIGLGARVAETEDGATVPHEERRSEGK